jgi:hypothetical protein
MTRTATEIATAYFRAVSSGDRNALREVLSEDVVYRFPGRSSYARVYQGITEVLAYLDKLREETEGSMSVEILNIMTSDEVAAGHVRATATKGDRKFSWSLVALITPREGKIATITLFYDDQYGVDSFLN